VVHPAAMWAGMMSPEQLAATGVQPSLVRFAVGLEDVEDLKADIAQALESIT
jgi:cystathionine beta-lyase/cystathionine gamma-synthase